ncbi:MAG: hypothetical protein EGP94_05170 [Lachnospiraceae bacterium]|nr:hypothetical protein [Lachnospiraceae bacterium]
MISVTGRFFTVHSRHSQKRVLDALRCFADLLSYDNKRFAQIALRRSESCRLRDPPQAKNPAKQDSFLLIKWRSLRTFL